MKGPLCPPVLTVPIFNQPTFPYSNPYDKKCLSDVKIIIHTLLSRRSGSLRLVQRALPANVSHSNSKPNSPIEEGIENCLQRSLRNHVRLNISWHLFREFNLTRALHSITSVSIFEVVHNSISAEADMASRSLLLRGRRAPGLSLLSGSGDRAPASPTVFIAVSQRDFLLLLYTTSHPAYYNAPSPLLPNYEHCLEWTVYSELKSVGKRGRVVYMS